MWEPGDIDAQERTAAVLASLQATVTRRRQVELDDLLLVLDWCELHRMEVLPDLPGAPHVPGGEREQCVGGEGTPKVQELALCELGIARGVHTLAARAMVADALDLRHRLPLTFAKVVALDADLWLARKVASMSRRVAADAIDVVDAAVADAIATQSPGRVLTIAEAKIVEADLPAHQKQWAEERTKRYVGLGRTDAHGLKHLIARITAGDAQWIDAMLERVADILATRPEHTATSRDELRSIAMGWLARPAELLQLLLEAREPSESDDHEESRATAFPADLLGALRAADPKTMRPGSILYVHLHEAALRGAAGVARVEGIGPMTLSALQELLSTTRVTVKGVIDLAEKVSTNAYEHPESVKERLHLLRPGEAFPHATTVSRNVDLDHPVPYDPGGPPGQTNSHHSQPLARTRHRAKTHLPYTCTPVPGGAEIIWRTPHGLHRLVDHHGTTVIDQSQADAWTGEDELNRSLERLLRSVRASAHS
jgi:hypothetical protein